MRETVESVERSASWYRPLPGLTPRAATSWWPDTGGTAPVRWLKGDHAGYRPGLDDDAATIPYGGFEPSAGDDPCPVNGRLPIR